MGLMSFLFFVVALLYALVGFGGGSSYLALMALFNVPYEQMPFLALICNVIVVTGGVFHFNRQGLIPWKMLRPLIVTSVPFSYLGASLPIPKDVFLLLLGLSLVAAGLRLLISWQPSSPLQLQPMNTSLGLGFGAGLGLLSGLVGIGGGIFLAPIVLLKRWATPKQTAALCSTFILLNSLSGLVGHVLRIQQWEGLGGYWPLTIAVLAGGQMGSLIGSRRLPALWVRQLTAGLVLLVGVRCLFRFF